MSKESLDDEINHDAIPFNERVAFQVILIQKMLGEGHKTKSREEKFPLEMEWAEKYAKKVSKFIDNPNNKEIRDLIFNHQYEEAALFIIPIIDSLNQ